MHRLIALTVLVVSSVLGSEAVAVGAPGPTQRAGSAPEVISEAVSFKVLHAGRPAVMRGRLYRPPGASRCDGSALVLIHALASGSYVFDLPGEPEHYGAARQLARAGFPVVTFDLLGYGASDHPDGRTLTNQAYTAVVGQVLDQLRAGTFAAASPTPFRHLGLLGTSFGSVIAEHLAAIRSDVAALVVMAWMHPPFIKEEAAQRFGSQEVPSAASAPDGYYPFGGRDRAWWFFNPSFSDPEVVAKDGELAGPAPAGHALSALLLATSRMATAVVRAPVLLVLGTGDVIVDSRFGEEELAFFASSPDRSLYRAPDAGHRILLAPNARETTDAIAAWLVARPGAIPACPGK